MQIFTRKYIWLWLIVTAAFIIRLVAGYTQSFSNDELSAIYRLQFPGLSSLLRWGVKVDGHPALVQLFLYYYTALVPKGEIFIRLPFILASTASLVFIFFSFKKISGEFTAYMVMLIMAFSGFAIQLGYFARPYAFGILFTSAAFYYWLRWYPEKSGLKKHFILYLLFSVLACYTHYFAFLQVVMLGLLSFFMVPVKRYGSILLAGLIMVICFIPHIPVTMYQLSVGGIGGWLGKPRDYFIIDLVLEFFNRSWWLAGICMLVSAIFLLYQEKSISWRPFFVAAFLSWLPFFILYLYSVRINPVLQYSACFFLFPFLLASFFSFFETATLSPLKIKAGMAVTVLVWLVHTTILYKVFAPVHFGEFKKIAAYIEQYESDSVTTVVAVNNPFYIDYYLQEKKPDLYITDMGSNLSFLKKYIDTCATPEFIYAFTNEQSNPVIPFMVREKFYGNVATSFFMNSEYYHFTKKHTYTDPCFTPMYSYTYNGKTFSTVTTDPPYVFSQTENQEFSPAFEMPLQSLSVHPYDRIIVSTGIYAREFCDQELVISIENGPESVYWGSAKVSFQYGIKDTTGARIHLYAGAGFDHEKTDLQKDILKAYVWNTGHCNTIAGPMTVEIYPGNPYTTGFQQ